MCVLSGPPELRDSQAAELGVLLWTGNPRPKMALPASWGSSVFRQTPHRYARPCGCCVVRARTGEPEDQGLE